MNGRASVSELASRMAAVVGARNCFSEGPDLLTYECDGLTHGRTRPDLVVLPGSTEEVAEVLRGFGCQHAQGWLYAKAMPLDDLRAWLARTPARATSA